MTSFGLYIHWPFCESKCPYCDFNSHVRQGIDVERWQRALLTELTACHGDMPVGTLKSIFFGGGTPSLMPPKMVEALIDKACELWSIPDAKNIEITLEANPSSVEAAKLKDFKLAGVNRLSMGVQSLRSEALMFLGRRHSVKEAETALNLAANTFKRFSFDLIYARPKQTLCAWEEELKQALKFAQGHLSLYQLTIEEGTAFYHAHKRGDFVLPSEDLAAQFYEVTQDIMADYGLPAYEVSNHAKTGQESQHNLIYWRYQPYGAIGPGAHGRHHKLGSYYALKRLKAPETWLEAVEMQGHGTDTLDLITQDQMFDECLMMGLRIIEGVSKESLKAIDAKRYDKIISGASFKKLYDYKYLTQTDTHISATLKGRLCLTTVTHACLNEG